MKKILLLATALLTSLITEAKDETVYGFEIANISYAVKGNTEVEVIRPLVKVYFGNVTIPAGVSYDGATYNVVSIGPHAFANMDIDRVTLPRTVTNITEGAFQASRLQHYLWPDQVKTMEPWVFADCPLLERIKIPNTVTALKSGALYGCPRLDSLIVPASVKLIDTLAISNCNHLTELSLSEGLEKIGFRAFKDDTRLTKLTLPSTVKSIGAEFVNGCGRLTEIKCLATEPPVIAKDPNNKKGLTTSLEKFGKKGKLTVPAGTKAKYQQAEGWKQVANITEE